MWRGQAIVAIHVGIGRSDMAKRAKFAYGLGTET